MPRVIGLARAARILRAHVDTAAASPTDRRQPCAPARQAENLPRARRTCHFEEVPDFITVERKRPKVPEIQPPALNFGPLPGALSPRYTRATFSIHANFA